MGNYYQEEIECAAPEKIKELQDERLVAQVKHVWSNVPFYRKKMEEAGISPEDIKGRDDLHKLPFSYKQDLRDTYPFGIASVPLDRCVRLHSSTRREPLMYLHRFRRFHLKNHQG